MLRQILRSFVPNSGSVLRRNGGTVSSDSFLFCADLTLGAGLGLMPEGDAPNQSSVLRRNGATV